MTLYFLIGPTASGKTDLALRWAEAHGGEILSCDAFCVYKGMDIGTAKPTKEEQERAPHHGIDVAPVSQPFSIADFVALAERVVADTQRRGVPLLVTGGSGFYAKSFFAPVTDQTNVPEETRQGVRKLIAEGGLEAVVKELLRLNPDGVQDLDLNNPRRIQTALERCLAAGKPLSVLQQEFRAQPAPFHYIEKKLCFIERDREDLFRRVEQRARKMIEDGLIEEVRRLRKAGLEQNPSAASAIGYREVIEWLDSGSSSTDELADAITVNTRRLIKKQLSFFRNQLPDGRRVTPGADGSIDLRSLFD